MPLWWRRQVSCYYETCCQLHVRLVSVSSEDNSIRTAHVCSCIPRNLSPVSTGLTLLSGSNNDVKLPDNKS
jgi:hypothetical protein